ncbi:glyceraldehyde-3-phosphate dehydrogenase, testis-specific [Canna indica]|uniref:Glyceraldehyde-3-phosphate dehydrogenase, testis-specific n=1 Tax=Canna indica TaxID=4628 RepID=A0AAQ3Q284_9LILI|nr:glyceraldehyde-3-phosphate dehydrogenase, testis-specific [Canna indica]
MRTAVFSPIAARLVHSTALFSRSPRLPLCRRRSPPIWISIAVRSCSTMESAGVENGKEEDKIGKTVEKPKPAEPSPTPLPLPPEKPLPGDCCGSGCVRCVWDIYYEEVEAYNESLRRASENK